MPQKRKQPRNKQSWVQLAQNFVDQWPEVLEGIELTNMPIHYVDSVAIILKNHITITVDIKSCLKKMGKKQTAAILKNYITYVWKKCIIIQIMINRLYLKM